MFALVPGPLGAWAANAAKGVLFQAYAQVVSNALAVVPSIGRFLFPTDTAASQIIQMGALSADFAQVILQVKNNLNLTLSSVMSNMTEFLAFAELGNFSTQPQNLPTLPEETNYLYYGFNTYLVSQALNGNDVYAVVGLGTDPVALATNGTKLNYDIDCKIYNEYNICDAWWYSENYKSAFTLDNFSHMNRGYGDALNQLFNNLTVGQLLFEGGYACNSQGNFGQAINITVNAGGLNTACISQLRVLTWDMTCHNRDFPDSSEECEFLEMPRQNRFWDSNTSPSFSDAMYSVPNGYLGPALTQTRDRLRRD